jgi:hypothetical protein
MELLDGLYTSISEITGYIKNNPIHKLDSVGVGRVKSTIVKYCETIVGGESCDMATRYIENMRVRILLIEKKHRIPPAVTKLLLEKWSKYRTSVEEAWGIMKGEISRETDVQLLREYFVNCIHMMNRYVGRRYTMGILVKQIVDVGEVGKLF